jgi:hypothetical protein
MDLNKFLNASLSLREATIEVPELASFFGDEKPVWTVRALTAAELGRADQSAERGTDNLRALVAAMAGEGDKAESIRKAMGLSDKDVPADVSRRIEMLAIGSVSPALGTEQRDVAVKLAETFPTTFYKLTNQIVNLTGLGADEGKRKPSGKAEKSEQ